MKSKKTRGISSSEQIIVRYRGAEQMLSDSGGVGASSHWSDLQKRLWIILVPGWGSSNIQTLLLSPGNDCVAGFAKCLKASDTPVMGTNGF